MDSLVVSHLKFFKEPFGGFLVFTSVFEQETKAASYAGVIFNFKKTAKVAKCSSGCVNAVLKPEKAKKTDIKGRFSQKFMQQIQTDAQ